MTRIALAGLGDHSLQSHLKPLLQVEGVQLAGAFDPKGDGFVRAQDKYNITLQRYPTLDAMLADKNVDAVLIGSPDPYHFPQLRASVEAGKHVFCEKPLCNDMREVEELEYVFEVARDNGLVIGSCHPRRYDPPYTWLKENMAELTDRFGQPLELKLDFTYNKGSDDKRHLHGGSLLQDHMNHEIDYMHFVFGHKDFDAMKLHDENNRYHVAGMRDDGLVFSFGGTRRLDAPEEEKSYSETIHVRFDRGDVHIDTYDQSRSYMYDHTVTKGKGAYEPVTGIAGTDYDARFLAINQNWIDTINGKAKNYLDEKDMLVNSRMSVVFAQSKAVRYEF